MEPERITAVANSIFNVWRGRRIGMDDRAEFVETVRQVIEFNRKWGTAAADGKEPK